MKHFINLNGFNKMRFKKEKYFYSSYENLNWLKFFEIVIEILNDSLKKGGKYKTSFPSVTFCNVIENITPWLFSVL